MENVLSRNLTPRVARGPLSDRFWEGFELLVALALIGKSV